MGGGIPPPGAPEVSVSAFVSLRARRIMTETPLLIHLTQDVIPMEVVFVQDVANKARAGEVRQVPDGYARNYLLPQGLALMATPEVLKRLHKIKSVGDEVRMRETRVLEEIKEALDGTEITVQARVTPTGRYYGAITATHISMTLAETVGREVERRWVEVPEPIREPGEYDVTMRLSTEIAATIHVTAEAEE